MTYLIGKRFTFAAAHQLRGLPEGHKCSRLHGHTYTAEVELSARDLTPPGFVTDFANLGPFGRHLEEKFDHRNLSETLDFEPTAENLARHFFEWCAEHIGRVSAVRVWESPSSWAEYRESPR
jgi:6-pyruvoyltetrahydropterin/6-carboxytetrahydropterin synthase